MIVQWIYLLTYFEKFNYCEKIWVTFLEQKLAALPLLAYLSRLFGGFKCSNTFLFRYYLLLDVINKFKVSDTMGDRIIDFMKSLVR